MGKDCIIGYTGFVGSNVSKKKNFSEFFNSQNIQDIKDKYFNTIVCAGAPGTKWFANKNPENDKQSIDNLITNLSEVECERLILISTVDVYKSPISVYENTGINEPELDAYGKNRKRLENFVKERFHSNIVRLPGLFGEGFKKNIIFDLLTKSNKDKIPVKGFYQFYPLSRIKEDLDLVVQNDIEIINFATEPISVSEIFNIFNTTGGNPQIAPPNYDMRTNFAKLWGNQKDYILNKEEIVENLKKFIYSYNIK